MNKRKITHKGKWYKIKYNLIYLPMHKAYSIFILYKLKRFYLELPITFYEERLTIVETVYKTTYSPKQFIKTLKNKRV